MSKLVMPEPDQDVLERRVEIVRDLRKIVPVIDDADQGGTGILPNTAQTVIP